MAIVDRVLAMHQARARYDDDFLQSYRRQQRALFDVDSRERHVAILKQATLALNNPASAPAAIARALGVEALQTAVANALASLHANVILLYDGLDEGWEATEEATATLGGLAAAISSFADAHAGIHGVVFVRDNMLRAVAHFDNDFSRTIETACLRLNWDEPSLLHLVTNRLRIALSVDAVQNDTKVWNRFAQHDISGQAGFAQCLHQTLHRPRDILVLLNRAFVIASRQGREEIIGSDVSTASTEISSERLTDLLREYAGVLPGLSKFIDLFRGKPAVNRLATLLALISEGIDFARQPLSGNTQAFPPFSSANEVFWVLYEVGFLGIRAPSEDRFTYCHDGSHSLNTELEPGRETLIHPCYWKALNVGPREFPAHLAETVSDDYVVIPSSKALDARARRIGGAVGGLEGIPEGQDGSMQFEHWVHSVITILFRGRLTNVELKPNPGAVAQRDIVATNMAEDGFWRRIREDYGTRQVVFEAKNYSELTLDDFRQILSYSGGEFGKFSVIVSRSKEEGANQRMRAWHQEFHTRHGLIIMLLPTVVVQRCLEKLRTAKKHDYTEEQLGKRMDTLIRSYLQISAGRRFRRSKKR